jgi:hypothetical protein
MISQYFTRGRIVPLLLFTRQRQNDMNVARMTRATFTIAIAFACQYVSGNTAARNFRFALFLS